MPFLLFCTYPFICWIVRISRNILPVEMAYLTVYLLLHLGYLRRLLYKRLVYRSYRRICVLLSKRQRGRRQLVGMLVGLVEYVLQARDGIRVHPVRQRLLRQGDGLRIIPEHILQSRYLLLHGHILPLTILERIL